MAGSSNAKRLELPGAIVFLVCAVSGWASVPAVGQTPPPDDDFDWITIGSPGNAPYQEQDPFGFAYGRGSVPYAYRMPRYETTTAQWLEFVNTFSTQSDDLAFFGLPFHWGARPDASYEGPGRRWELIDAPDAAWRPVFGISWRTAAMYCNWLHNDKSAALSSLENGSYDTSTFTFNEDGTFNDQLTHHPDARFWIPTFDEWIKAAHYDAESVGWWAYSHRAFSPPIPGPPGEPGAQTSAGYEDPPFGHYDIPLGAYPNGASAYGLLDVTGGAREWTEEVFQMRSRYMDGAPAGPTGPATLDHIGSVRLGHPNATGLNGIRIASAIPAPGPASLLVVMLGSWAFKRRRTQ